MLTVSDDIATIRATLIAWGTHLHEYRRREDCLAALDRVADRLANGSSAALTGRIKQLTDRLATAEARVETLTEALRQVANRTYPASFVGTVDGTRVYGHSDDVSRFARAALGETDQ